MRISARNRFMTVLGVAVMLFHLFGCSGSPRGQHTSMPDASGACGTDMTWEYKRSTKTLTITGSGEMVTPERLI